MGIREDELAGITTGNAANPNALRSRSPIASLANAISERAASADPARSALAANQPGAALSEAVAARSPRVAMNTQPGAALDEAVAARASRVAFGNQPGAALNEAATARMGPPTPAPMRIAAQQPGAGLAEAVAARTPQAEAMRVAQPRTSYSLTGDSAPAAMPKPQTAALLQGAPGSAPAAPQTVSGADLAGRPQPAGAPPAAPNPDVAAQRAVATRAALNQQPGSALANAAAARNPLQGPPAPRPVSPPLTPNQLPGTAQWPNPNTGGAGAMSREASNWNMERQALAGPTQSGAPLTPAPQTADKAGTVSRLRTMLGLGQNGGAAPSGQPGAIRSAANTLVGSGEDWAKWSQSKGAQNALKVAKGAGTVAKVVAVPLAVNEMATGIKEGNATKAGVGALDTLAAGAMFTPAAPVAATYGAVRAGYEAGQALPETWRDAIGSGVNKVANLFGGGVDDTQYKRMNAEYDARQLAQAQAAANAAKVGAGAKAPPKTIADVSKTPPPGNPPPDKMTPPPAVPRGPAGPDPQVAALTERYNGLQSMLDASPVSRVLLGGAQSAVYYKDGTVHNLQPGEALPDAVQQHLAIGNAMTQIENGSYRQPASNGAPAGKTLDASTLSGNRKVVYDAAGQAGLDPAKALMIASIETGGKFNADAKNPNSSAQGIFQLLKANRSGTPAEQADPTHQAAAGVAHIMATEKALTSSLGRAPSPSESYMGHLFGASGATTLLNADANAPVQKIIASYDPKNAAAIVKNNGLSGMTVGDVLDKMQGLVTQHYPGGATTFSSSTPMQAPAVATLDGEAAPGAVPTAAPARAERAPYDPAPVQMIRGLDQSTALPNGGGAGYTEVPTDIYQAGVRSGNTDLGGRGPIANYAANVVQGQNFAANPASARLAGETIKANSDERVANIGLEGVRTKAQADRDVETTKADTARSSARNQIFMADEVVGVDSMGNDIIKKVPYRMGEDGNPVRATPGPKTWPIPNKEAVALLAENGNAPAFDEEFGPGAAAKYGKKDK